MASRPSHTISGRTTKAATGSAHFACQIALIVVVTLLGWMALIKSLFFLFLPPEMEAGFFLQQLHYQHLFYLYSAISLVLGVYLTYGGFQSRSH